MISEKPNHSQRSKRLRCGARLFLTLTLAAACVPAFAFSPQQAKEEANTAAQPVATQAPQLLPAASASIATPDTASLSAQIEMLRQAAKAQASETSLIKSVLQRAFSLIGTPYRYGGSSPDAGFDCSGLVGYVFRTIGIDLPRVSRAMASEGVKVATRDALAEGDLVFFGKRGHIDHVGIYIGDGKFLHAPSSGRDVTISSLTTGYWAQKYLEARRVASNS